MRCVLLLGVGCSAKGPETHGPLRLSVWRHESRDPELSASLASLNRFDAQRPDIHLEVETIPEGSYTSAITAAALARKLPCVMDVDQPTVPNFAWAGHLRPLDDLLPKEALEALMPGAKTRFQGRLYAVGQFDVVVALLSRRSDLERLQARVATLDAPYTPAELRAILRKARAEDEAKGPPLDLSLVYKGEWLPYAFAPWLISAGAGLLDAKDPRIAEGTLNGPEARGVLQWIQDLVEEGLILAHPVDDRAFIQGRALVHYAGSWVADRTLAAVGSDLVLMPPPDFGQGPKIGSGSWQWGIARSCPAPQAAADLIAFLLSVDEVAQLSRATGFVPVSEAAAAQTERFAPGGRWRSFYEFAASMAVPRPATPGYPKVSAAFQKAFLNVVDGAPAQEALDGAVDAIELDAVRNRGYGFRGLKR